ncbi:MAG: metallophosphoesterase [Chloroflexota bacterium]
MRILALSDQVMDFLYSPLVGERFGDVDVLVSCGDLPAYYLEYMVTQLNVPLLYVPGNHDPDDLRVPGGRALDGAVARVEGALFAGLGGSRRYKPDGRHQYSEGEMQWRVAQLAVRLWLSRLRGGRGLDVVVTHAPPLHIHDAPDLPHLGFASFLGLLTVFRPRLLLHGHSHAQRNIEITDTTVSGTRIVNVFPYRVIDLAVPA